MVLLRDHYDEEEEWKPVTSSNDPKRIIFLNGDKGSLACRLYQGHTTLPRWSGGDGLVMASARTNQRLANISVLRNDTDDQDLGRNMIGPNHYFGTLTDLHRYRYRVEIDSQTRIPTFFRSSRRRREIQREDAGGPFEGGLWVRSAWISGKVPDNKPRLREMLGGEDEAEVAAAAIPSLTPDTGILLLETTDGCITLPLVDPEQVAADGLVDLSKFRVNLVRNEDPFVIIPDGGPPEDPMDVITYHFGPQYAAAQTEPGKMGLFLETHTFTQIMTPLTASSGGYIVLGRRRERESESLFNGQGNDSSGEWQDLLLIALRIPLGYTLIVMPGAIHGDSTFIGTYAMAMTVNHTTMRTADVVFLRDTANPRINVRFSVEERCLSDDTNNNYKNHSLAPIAFPKAGACREAILDDSIRQIQAIESPSNSKTTIFQTVFNPFNFGWLTYQWRRMFAAAQGDS